MTALYVYLLCHRMHASGSRRASSQQEGGNRTTAASDDLGGTGDRRRRPHEILPLTEDGIAGLMLQQRDATAPWMHQQRDAGGSEFAEPEVEARNRSAPKIGSPMETDETEPPPAYATVVALLSVPVPAEFLSGPEPTSHDYEVDYV
jgi:hypothetical protein